VGSLQRSPDQTLLNLGGAGVREGGLGILGQEKRREEGKEEGEER